MTAAASVAGARRPLAALAAGAVLATALAAVPPPASAAPAPFAPATTIPLGATTGLWALAVGDFDADGTQDLAIVDSAGDGLELRQGQGDGTFRGGGSLTGLGLAQDIALADFDADGRQDAAVAARIGATDDVAVLLGLGDGAAARRVTLDLPELVHAVAVCDANGDGHADLLATSDAHLYVRLGNGNGTFAGGVDKPIAAGPDSPAVGDFDGDTIEDVALLLGTGETAIARGTGTGAFPELRAIPLPRPGTRLVVGSFDGDHRADVAATVPGTDRVEVRLGRGDGMLLDRGESVAVGDRPTAVAVGDFDGDGVQDLAVAEYDGDTVSVRFGNGDGTFRDGGDVAAGDGPQALAVGDFDGDGVQDLAVAAYIEGVVRVLRGTSPSPLAGNLLVNGGFEQGVGAALPAQAPAIPGWERTGGATFVRYGTVPHRGFPALLLAPRLGGGRNVLWGGDSTGLGGRTTASQTVDVAAGAAAIDAGATTARVSAQLGGSLAYPDAMSVDVAFLDGAGSVLGSTDFGGVGAQQRHNQTTLLPRRIAQAVPAGTRRIRITLISNDNDTISSATADNVVLTLDPPLPAPVPPTGGGGASPDTPEPEPEPEPAPAGRFGAGANVTLALARRRVRAGGPLPVRVVNRNAFAVTGRLAGRGRTTRRGKPRTLALAGVRLAVAAGARTTVRMRLPKPLRRQLARGGRLRVSLTATVRDPAGARRVVRVRAGARLAAVRTHR